MNRRILLAVIVLLVLYIAGTVLVRYIRYASTPEWKRQITLIQPLEETGVLSAEFVGSSNFLQSELLHANNWSKEEVDKLLGFLEIPDIRDDQLVGGDSFSQELLEVWLLRDTALNTISERIRVDAPIGEDQRDKLIDALIGDLYQTKSSRAFQFAPTKVIDSGLASTPGPIRDRVLYIYENPREFFGTDGLSVAENIKRQLKHRGVFILEGETHQ